VFQALTFDGTELFRRFLLRLKSSINIALFRTSISRGYVVKLSDDWTGGIIGYNSEVNIRNLK
jgi:hypothetical protein